VRLGNCRVSAVCPYETSSPVHTRRQTGGALTEMADLSTARAALVSPAKFMSTSARRRNSVTHSASRFYQRRFYMACRLFLNGAPVTEESDLFGGARRHRHGLHRQSAIQINDLGDVSNPDSAPDRECHSIAANITRFRRPETAAWDPRKGDKHRNDAYFGPRRTSTPTAVSGACASTTSGRSEKADHRDPVATGRGPQDAR